MAILWSVAHGVEPSLIVLLFASSYVVSWVTLQKPIIGLPIWQRRTSLLLTAAVEISFIVQTLLYYSRPDENPSLDPSTTSYLLFSTLAWLLITLTLVGNQTPLWKPYIAAWSLAELFEIVLLVLNATHKPRLEFGQYLLFNVIRLVFLTLLLLNVLAIVRHKPPSVTDEEQTPLLQNGEPNGTAYGAATDTATDATGSGSESADEEADDRDKAIKEQQQKRLEAEGGWIGYLKAFSIFIPHVWPSHDWVGKACVFVIFTIIISERFLNILVPRQIGIVTTKLTEGAKFSDVWFDVVLWTLYEVINGWTGLNLVKSIAEQYLQNYSYSAISRIAFGHVMDLSMDFHNDKDSGEVIRSVRQANALNDILEVFMEIIPLLFDIVIGVVYLSVFLFDQKMAFIILGVGIVYIFLAANTTAWTRPYRRTYMTSQRDESKTLYETISSWTTVTYFNRAPYESKRFGDAVGNVITTQWGYILRNYAANFLLDGVTNLAFAAAVFVAVWEISHGRKPIGNLVTLLLYWSSILYPLYHMNYSARRIVANLIDAERILQLLRTVPTVRNADDARELEVSDGEVKFDTVSFDYGEGRKVVKDSSFTAKPGQTIAFVGPTGSGKSTLLKLLFRFYDVTKGAIKIDGQDIKDVTLSSLREQIGVVPQDPSLFNQTIMENIRYAKLDATDEEIISACKAAAVYDKIQTFPKGMQSKVGERGVKLSGGELQRVAIARVLLKNPKIVLLDEATSAIDSGTEQQIQEAFKQLSIGRTTFVIAHRLSTISDADLILFIDEGEIIERGSHDELFKARGRYFDLWTKQTNAILSKVSKANEAEDLLIDDLPSDSQVSKELKEELKETDEKKGDKKGDGNDVDEEEDSKDTSSSATTLKPDEP
jgi:ABC-type transport system involved in Fe-S cluster assembly fused permease/ATPase subunit